MVFLFKVFVIKVVVNVFEKGFNIKLFLFELVLMICFNNVIGFCVG